MGTGQSHLSGARYMVGGRRLFRPEGPRDGSRGRSEASPRNTNLVGKPQRGAGDMTWGRTSVAPFGAQRHNPLTGGSATANGAVAPPPATIHRPLRGEIQRGSYDLDAIALRNPRTARAGAWHAAKWHPGILHFKPPNPHIPPTINVESPRDSRLFVANERSTSCEY